MWCPPPLQEGICEIDGGWERHISGSSTPDGRASFSCKSDLAPATPGNPALDHRGARGSPVRLYECNPGNLEPNDLSIFRHALWLAIMFGDQHRVSLPTPFVLFHPCDPL